MTSWTWSWSKNSFNASSFRVLVLFKLCDSRRLIQLTQWGVSVRHCFKIWKIILLTPQISIRGQFILNWSDYHKTNTARDIYFVVGDPGILESQPGLLFEERLYTTDIQLASLKNIVDCLKIWCTCKICFCDNYC